MLRQTRTCAKCCGSAAIGFISASRILPPAGCAALLQTYASAVHDVARDDEALGARLNSARASRRGGGAGRRGGAPRARRAPPRGGARRETIAKSLPVACSDGRAAEAVAMLRLPPLSLPRRAFQARGASSATASEPRLASSQPSLSFAASPPAKSAVCADVRTAARRAEV